MILRVPLWLILLLCALYTLPLAAQHVTLSRPFLERTGFLLESAGFRARLADDEATRRALRALPPHRFVTHGPPGAQRYLFGDPGVCNCIFSGTRDNWLSYRDMLRNPAAGVDDVAPDYRTQASALLADPIGADTLGDAAAIDLDAMRFP